jgi:quercetin dioxygenase-like cupin family protein
LAEAVLRFDLGAEIASLKCEASWQGGDRNARTLVEEPNLRLVLVVMKYGARLREHQTNGRVTVHTLEGRVQMRFPGRTAVLLPGQLLTIDRDVAHDLEALEESAFFLTIAWEGADGGGPGPHGYRRPADDGGQRSSIDDRNDGDDPRLRRQYRVLRMEPLIGDGRPDTRTGAVSGTAGAAAGPTMQAAREFEGQMVTLDQLAGMGQFTWLSDRVARLDTASESYRVELEPLLPPVD